MSQETEVILKQLLLQILKAETLIEAQGAIKFLCTKEDIAEAEKLITEMKQNK
jgi:hypothetical protein